MIIHAYAAHKIGGEFQPFEYEVGPLAPQEVEIDIRYCGICHSDLSMLDNDWGMTTYPFVPGHEVIGVVAQVGEQVNQVKPEQTVGLGWFSQSCMSCAQCLSGDHNLCGESEATIVGRHGGFADKVRAHASWVLPLPEAIAPMVETLPMNRANEAMARLRSGKPRYRIVLSNADFEAA